MRSNTPAPSTTTVIRGARTGLYVTLLARLPAAVHRPSAFAAFWATRPRATNCTVTPSRRSTCSGRPRPSPAPPATRRSWWRSVARSGCSIYVRDGRRKASPSSTGPCTWPPTPIPTTCAWSCSIAASPLLDRFAIDAARDDFAECARISAGTGDRVCEAAARHNLGYAEFLAGDLPQALHDMAESARITPGGPHPTGMLDEARVLIDAGLTTDADGALAHVAGLFRRQGLTHDVAETVYARAADRAHRTSVGRCSPVRPGRPRNVPATRQRPVGPARPAARTVRPPRRAHRQPSRHPASHQRTLASAGPRVGVDRGPGDDARERQRGRRPGRHRENRDADRGGGHRCRRRPDDLSSLRVPTVQPYDSLTSRLHIRRVRARLAWARGDSRTAAGRSIWPLPISTDRRRRLASADLRTAVAVHGVALAELDVERATRSGSPSPS